MASTVGVGVACGNNVDDEEKAAIDAAHEEVMEVDESGAQLEDAEAMLGGLCKQAEGVYDVAHDEVVTDHVAEFASGISGMDATLGASSAATIDQMGSWDLQCTLTQLFLARPTANQCI